MTHSSQNGGGGSHCGVTQGHAGATHTEALEHLGRRDSCKQEPLLWLIHEEIYKLAKQVYVL